MLNNQKGIHSHNNKAMLHVRFPDESDANADKSAKQLQTNLDTNCKKSSPQSEATKESVHDYQRS